MVGEIFRSALKSAFSAAGRDHSPAAWPRGPFPGTLVKLVFSVFRSRNTIETPGCVANGRKALKAWPHPGIRLPFGRSSAVA